jgi:two-component system, sensor histidine kinase
MHLKRVLVVEDNLINHKMLSRMLAGHFLTTSAYTGKQAIDAAAREHFDVVLMDVQMPVRNFA